MKPMIEESKIEEKNLIIRNEESNTISSKKQKSEKIKPISYQNF